MTIRATKEHRSAPALCLAVGLILLAGLQPAAAVTQIESTYGGQSPWFSAELNGQSVTGAAMYRGGFSNLLNPAGVARATGLRVDLGFNATHHEEDRFVELYDTFGSFVDDAAIASNQNTWWGGGYALAYQLENEDVPVGIALSLVDRYPFAYRFEEELRDPDVFSSPRDRILENRRYEVSGTIRQLSLGLAAEPWRWLAFGASLHYAFGDRQEAWDVRDFDTNDGDDSYNHATSWDLSGVNATFGLQSQVSDRVRLGVAYETRLNLDGDFSTSQFNAGDAAPADTTFWANLRYPEYWRFGGTFHPRSDPRTVFTLDVIYADWSKLQDSRLGDQQPHLQEVVDFRVGLQHTFYNDFDLRFGFRRYDSYADDEGGNSVFGIGGGFPVVGGQLSASIELNKQQVRLEHIFEYPDDDDFVTDPEARVDDLRFRFGLGWAREF
jgi:hypothetical protein